VVFTVSEKLDFLTDVIVSPAHGLPLEDICRAVACMSSWLLGLTISASICGLVYPTYVNTPCIYIGSNYLVSYTLTAVREEEAAAAAGRGHSQHSELSNSKQENKASKPFPSYLFHHI
jgi:hypothetical protein